MAWFWLILGGLFEVGFTTALRFVDGFRNLPWTLAFLASVTASMGLLELAARSIPMGTAYAVWGGIGAAGTVINNLAAAAAMRPSASARDIGAGTTPVLRSLDTISSASANADSSAHVRSSASDRAQPGCGIPSSITASTASR